MATMGKTSFLTPVYLFSSIRAGSGKASTVANLAIFLNNLGQKLAIVDLDHEAPLKLKNSLSSSIILQEYNDISQLAKSTDSRYQKNFYFTETSQISYFPAHKLPDPALLFTDTTLRDFLIQVKAGFQVLLINFPAGIAACQKISELMTRSYLWRGNMPVATIVSLSDQRSLVSLDELIQSSGAFLYQLKENTLIFFNRVPGSPAEQRLADNSLNSTELRKLFSQPHTYIAGVNDEVNQQRLVATPIVLNPDSLLNQTISSLYRVISRLGENPLRDITDKAADYFPVLDGELLDKLAPFLEKIQIQSAGKLFAHPSQIQVFLEESATSFRIRIRTSGLYQPLLGINAKITVKANNTCIVRGSPKTFKYAETCSLKKNLTLYDKPVLLNLANPPVYQFDDRFAYKTTFSLQTIDDLAPKKNRYPSPILFKPTNELPEIPSLAHILGFSRRRYKPLDFPANSQLFAIPGVTHFFIPPEFELSYSNKCLFKPSFYTSLKLDFRQKITHSKQFIPAYELPEDNRNDAPELPDCFARNQKFVPENDFLTRPSVEAANEFGLISKPQTSFSFAWPPRLVEIYQNNSGSASLILELPFAALELYEARLLRHVKDPVCYQQQNVPKKPQKPRFTHFNTIEKQFSCLEKSDFKHSMSSARKVFNSGFAQKFIPKGLESAFTVTRKDHFAVPQNIDHQTPFATKLHFLQRTAKKLPEMLAIEALLLDQSYAKWQIKTQTSRYGIQQKFTDKPPLFVCNTFFPQPFTDRIFASLPTRVNFTADSVKQIFQVSYTAFKPFPHLFSVRRSNLAYEIFTVSHKLRLDKNYRDHHSPEIFKTDDLLDSFIESHSLPIVKHRMLELKMGNLQPWPLNNKLQVKPHLPEYSNITTKADDICPSNREINWDLSFSDRLAKHQIPPLLLPKAVTNEFFGWLNSLRPLLKNVTGFSFNDFNLQTIPVRSVFKKFFDFKGDNNLGIKNLVFAPISQLFVYKGPAVKKFSYDLVCSKLIIPATIPTRLKKLESPTISVSALLETNLILPHCDFSIKTPRNGLYAYHAARQKYLRTSNHPALQLPKVVLSASCEQPFVVFKPKSQIYSTIFPDIYDELFNLLQHNIRHSKESVLPHDFKKVTSAIAPIKIKHSDEKVTVAPISYDERTQAGVKMPAPGRDRIKVAVANTRVRDLMNLARQATQKFSEITNRMRT